MILDRGDDRCDCPSPPLFCCCRCCSIALVDVAAVTDEGIGVMGGPYREPSKLRHAMS